MRFISRLGRHIAVWRNTVVVIIITENIKTIIRVIIEVAIIRLLLETVIRINLVIFIITK